MNTENTEFELMESTPSAEGSQSLLKHEETADERIAQEIKRFSLPDAKIAELKKKFGKLKIRQLPAADDKAAMKLYRDEKKVVQEALAVVRKVRTSLEGKRKELKADYLKIGKGIDAEASRLTDLVSPLEVQLKEHWDASEKAETDRENEAERLAQEKLQGRVRDLLDAGIQFDGSFYSIGDISVDVVTLKTFKDEQFAALLAKVQEVKAKKDEEAAAEQKRLDEEKRLEEEAKLKLKEDQDKLEKERIAFQKEKDELKAAQEKQRELEIKNRRLSIEGLGLIYNSGIYGYVFFCPSGRVEVKLSEITESSEEQWTSILSNVEGLVKEAKAKESERLETLERQEKEKTDRQNKLVSLGLSFDGEQFRYKDINFHWTDILTMSGEQFAKAIEGATARMQQLKEEEAAETRIDERANARISQLQTMGYTFYPPTEQSPAVLIYSKPGIAGFRVPYQTLREINAEAWGMQLKLFLDEANKIEAAWQKAEDEKAAKLEADRKAAMNEIELVAEYFQKLNSIEKPEIKTVAVLEMTEKFFIEFAAVTISLKNLN